MPRLQFIYHLWRIFGYNPLSVRLYLGIRVMLIPRAFFVLLNTLAKQQPNRVLDIGCGHGIVTLYLRAIGYRGEILACDIDQDRIESLQKLASLTDLGDTTFIVRDLITEGLPEKWHADVAIILDLMHHLDRTSQYTLIKKLAADNVTSLVIKDIDITPRWKYYWNHFHDSIVMKSEIVEPIGSQEMIALLEQSLYLNTEHKAMFSIFPYPHYCLYAQR